MVVSQGIVLALLTVSVARCRPVSVHGYAPHHNDYTPTDYSFSYGVKDPHTGDVKHQWEKKIGDKITGHYSLVEPDGSVRSVDYTADHHSGFNAVVKHSGVSQHPSAHAHHHSEPVSHKEVVLKPGEYQSYHHLDYKHAAEVGEDLEYHQGLQQKEEEDEAVEYQVPQGHEEEETEQGAKQQYVYLTQDGAAEESQHHNHGYKYVLPHDKHEVKPKVTVKEEYEKVKVLPQLPIDLSLLKHDTVEKVVPVDVSVIKPIEIDVSGQRAQPMRELSQHDIDKYLEEYYGGSPNKIDGSQPQLEGGFKPLQQQQQQQPQLYRSNKRPSSTPGLGRYSTRNSGTGRFSKRYYSQYQGETRDRAYHGHVSRLYKTLPDGYVRYAKHVSYEE